MINEYLCQEQLEKLCNELEMPHEATVLVIKYSHMDFSPINNYFMELFDINNGENSVKSIESFCGSDNDGIKALTVYLSAAIRAKGLYVNKGINEKIYIDTMKIFTRFVNEHFASFGRYGFDRGWWIYRILSLSLFRIGALEYEMKVLDEERCGFKEGTAALSVHIPSDAVMTRKNLDNSYKEANDFFSKYFPHHKYELAYCNTWLLAPVLSEILSLKSKILLFREDYDIVSVDYENNDYLNWVFKKNPNTFTEYNLLPENTSLERGLKAHVLSGEKVGIALGILRKLI